MTTLAPIVLFLLGLHVGLRMVAALYRIIDLWYMIGTAYPRVLGGIAGWAGTTVVIAMLLPDELSAVFLWGVAAFIPFYLGLYLIRYPLLRRRSGLTHGVGETVDQALLHGQPGQRVP
ncbi:MAG: hypothetical protein HY337_09275 [Gemmatimonadetes bacterium]|nr:hypothetical protein [Gemmatimonadota bacterium]